MFTKQCLHLRGSYLFPRYMGLEIAPLGCRQYLSRGTSAEVPQPRYLSYWVCQSLLWGAASTSAEVPQPRYLSRETAILGCRPRYPSRCLRQGPKAITENFSVIRFPFFYNFPAALPSPPPAEVDAQGIGHWGAYKVELSKPRHLSLGASA